jgi:DIS3-like exonuclease 1
LSFPGDEDAISSDKMSVDGGGGNAVPRVGKTHRKRQKLCRTTTTTRNGEEEETTSGVIRGMALLRSTEEVYVREDISCGFPGCLECENSRAGTPLNASCEYLLVPASARAIDAFGAQFWEGLALRDCILCKSVETRAREMFSSNPRLMRAMRSVHEDARRDGFLFDDVHSRKVREIARSRGCGLVEATAEFYAKKVKALGGETRKPRIVVLTTKNTKRKAICDDLVTEMYALEYIAKYHSQDEALMLRVQAALEEKDRENEEEEDANEDATFSDYITRVEVEEGIANGTIVVGQMRVDSSRTSAIVNRSIRIDSKVKMNRALHLDTVAVDVNTNEVVYVVSRKQMEFTCVLDEHDADDSRLAQRNSVLVVPRESSKLPRFKMFKNAPDTLKGKVFSVRFSSWSRQKTFPDAHFLKVIGGVGSFQGEVDAVLTSCMIRKEPFGAKANSELPRSDWRIPQSELDTRRDFRKDPATVIFSVDPPGCVDVDDAMSVKKLDSGCYQIGVHIADVSFFVREKSALDAEGKARGTTVYLPNERIDMLPEILSANLCSLLEGQDRLAVSCIWCVDENLDMKEKPWFGRSIIRNRKAIDYYSAQALLDEGDVGCANNMRDFYDALCVLTSFANKRRQVREINGALELASAELRFETHADAGDREKLTSAERTTVVEKRDVFTMKTVAELMISANCACAERIYTHFLEGSFVRRHKMPAADAFDDIKKYCCEFLNFDSFNSSSGVALNESLSKAIRLSTSFRASAEAFFRGNAAQKMQEAEYCVCDGATSSSHFGLAVDLYTHFTSPIRRYADIIAHRQLLRAIDDTKKSSDSVDLSKKSNLHDLAEHLNERTRMSKVVQRKVSEVYLAFSMLNDAKTKIGMVECYEKEREVLKVFLPSWHLRGNVFLRDESDVETLEPCGLGGVSINKGEREFHPLHKIYIEVSATSSYKSGIQLKFKLSEASKLAPDDDTDLKEADEKLDIENAPELARAFEKSVTISSTKRKKALLERNEQREYTAKTDGDTSANAFVPPNSFRKKTLDLYSINLLSLKAALEMKCSRTRVMDNEQSKTRYARRRARFDKVQHDLA